MKDPIIFQPKGELERELPPTSFKLSPTVKFTTWKDAGKPKSASKTPLLSEEKTPSCSCSSCFSASASYFPAICWSNERAQKHSVFPPPSYRSAKPKKKRKTDTQSHKSRSTKLRRFFGLPWLEHTLSVKENGTGACVGLAATRKSKESSLSNAEKPERTGTRAQSARRRRKEASNNKPTNKSIPWKTATKQSKRHETKHTQLSNPT